MSSPQTPTRMRPPTLPPIGSTTEAPRSTTPLRLRGHARESSVSSVGVVSDNLTGRWRDTTLIVEVDVGATNAEAIKALQELRLDLWDPTIQKVELVKGIWGATGSRLAVEATFGWLSGRYLMDVIHADTLNMNWTLGGPTPFGDRELTIKLFAPTPQTSKIFLQYDYKLKALYRMMFKPVLRSVFERIAQSACYGFKTFVETGRTAKYLGKFTGTPDDVPEELRGADSTPRSSGAPRERRGSVSRERRGSFTRRGSVSKQRNSGGTKRHTKNASRSTISVPDVPDAPEASTGGKIPPPEVPDVPGK